MINRACVLLKYKAPFVNWINRADPAGENPNLTIEEVNSDRTVYLVHEEVADAPEMLEGWLKQNCETLFESELECWYTDESVWPKNRNFALFNQWVSAECHSAIVDTLDTPIVDDELA